MLQPDALALAQKEPEPLAWLPLEPPLLAWQGPPF